VAEVGMTDIGLLSGDSSSSSIEVEGYKAAEDEDMNPRNATVTPGFFDAVGMPIVRGRGFTEADREGSPRVAVINQKMAQYFFKDSDPIGRRFKFGRSEHWVEIVGVARDSAWRNLREDRTRNLFLPFAQNYDGAGLVVYVRAAAGDPERLQADIRRVVAEIDPQLPLSDMRSFRRVLESSLSNERMARTVSGAFAVVAVLLAAIGLYGLLAYAVAGRARELGLRMALGATKSEVVRLVVRDGLKPVVAGLLVGLAIAIPAARLLASQLYAVQPYDLPSFLIVPPVLLLAGLLAAFFPATRAARVDPARALRQE
jgi:putative ABC transport system permease protein